MPATRIPIQRRKRADGGVSYRVQVRLSGAFPITKTFRRLTDAKEWFAKMAHQIHDQQDFPEREARRRTVVELVDRRLEMVARDKPHALGKQTQLLTWWKDQIGPFKLAQVTPAVIAQKRDELLAENIGTDEEPRRRSPATVNRYLAALAKAMAVAVREWHWLQDNPAHHVTKGTETTGRVRYLDDDERERLLKTCRQSPLAELELMVMLAISTGMRRGEILGLRWPDLDMKRHQAVLHKTKNRERRSVPLVPQVHGLLEAHAKVRRLDTDLVFPQPGKEVPIDPAHWFEKAVAAAKIEDFRFHDLRHTAASYLAMSGATAGEIAAVLGHKTLAMVKRYAHLSDAHTTTVVERMNKKFLGDAPA